MAERAGRLTRSLALPFLLSLVLAVQVAGAFGHQGTPTGGAPTDTSALSAAIGQPIVLCLHGDPDGPAPAMPGDCDHCVVCHVLAGCALVPGGTRLPRPAPIVARLTRPAGPGTLPQPRLAGNVGPRGPPTLV